VFYFYVFVLSIKLCTFTNVISSVLQLTVLIGHPVWKYPALRGSPWETFGEPSISFVDYKNWQVLQKARVVLMLLLLLLCK